MNESADTTELDGLLEECEGFFAVLSERSARELEAWKRAAGSVRSIAKERAAEPDPLGSEDFGAALHRLQRGRLRLWRDLLKATVDLERERGERAREQSELARLSAQAMVLGRARIETVETVSQLRADLELKRVEIDETRETVDRLQSQIALRSRELESAAEQLALLAREKQESEEREAHLTEAIEALEKVRVGLESRLEELEGEVADLRSKVDPVTAELSRARERVADLEAEIRQVRERTVPLEDLEAVRSEKGELEARVRDLSQALDEKTRAEEESARRLEAEHGEREVLAARLAKLESDFVGVEGLKRENDRLKERLAQMGKGTPEAAAIVQATAEAAERVRNMGPIPFPEIPKDGLEGLSGKKVLLVGGDFRFQSDYEHLFRSAEAEVDYFPSILQLEKRGMDDFVRECDLVAAFGGALQEPGLHRLRETCGRLERRLIEHPSSGLVSLSHQLRRALGRS